MYSEQYKLGYQVDVKNQGGWGTCYQNALTSTIESLMQQAGHAIAPLSRLQSYYDTRELQGTLGSDSGSIGYMVLAAAQGSGIAPESMWGYSSDHLYSKAPTQVYAAASQMQVATFRSIYNFTSAEVQRDNVLEYLSQGKSVIAGFHIRQYFYDEHGPLSQQNSDGLGDRLGGHAVQIVGYDASIDGGSYIVKNSWGTGWGDNGYGTINYKQMALDFISMEIVTGMRINGQYIDFNYEPVKERVAEQYVAVLGRAPDLAGMMWQIENNLNAVATRGLFADALINSTEGQLIYGTLDNQQFVNSVYKNVLGREAEAAGKHYWASIIDSGTTRGSVLDMIVDAVRVGNTETHEMIDNIVNLAMYITIALQYDGTENVAVRQEIASVTADDYTLEIIKVGIPHDWSVM